MSALLKLPWTLRSPAFVFVAALTLGALALGQSSQSSGQSKAASQNSATTQNPTEFAIESEMLTYTVMDSEGAAVACGIARNVGAADDRCTPQAISGPPIGVVVVSSGSSALAEFQLWRTDISTMDMLTLRANRYCPKAPVERGTSTSLESQILSIFPESQAVSIAQSLLSASAETSPLEGNILDRTLANDVAGHLRALGIDVVIPDTYMPLSLTAIDLTHSPFLSKYFALIKARGCLTPVAPEKAVGLRSVVPGPAAEACPPAGREIDAQAEADKKAITDAIDIFLKSLTEPEAPSAPKPPEGASAAPPGPVISHLNAVLRADGLAQELDSASPDARSGANGIWYVLSLKALESGGTLLKTGNTILGTKTSYSGGAVGTYALFRLNGSLACSGVFFNYEQPTLTSKIPALLQNAQQPQPGKLVGGCSR
ncbi:MAG: hypothetical protein ABR898_07545 [Terracidiphilus sp.]|jgi:hypothetical protein